MNDDCIRLQWVRMRLVFLSWFAVYHVATSAGRLEGNAAKSIQFQPCTECVRTKHKLTVLISMSASILGTCKKTENFT